MARLTVPKVPTFVKGLCRPGGVLVAVGIAGSMAGANTLATDGSPGGMVGTILGGLNSMQPISILFL